MGQYKVPQNVEAEDKILGPLSLKQFIYALIGLGWGFLTFAILKSVILLWVIIGVPPALALLGLGLYQKEDQSLETYVLAVVQFFTRPRNRIWQKEPVAEVFHLEPPPPKPELAMRDPRQVRSQLSQLADVVDTRGWSTKESAVQEPDEVPVVDLQGRIGAEVLQQQQPVAFQVSDVSDNDDILATQTPAAHSLNLLIENSVKSIREEAREKMRTQGNAVSATEDALAAVNATAPMPAATPGTQVAPAASQGVPAAVAAAATISSSTPPPSDAIVKLAAEGGGLTVAQIAAQARKTTQTLAEGQTVSLR